MSISTQKKEKRLKKDIESLLDLKKQETKAIARRHPLIIYDTKERKPMIGVRVIVCGGSALWTGECWKSVMEQKPSGDYYEIQWEVKWWAEFPKFIHYQV